jgi:hypothetical protein
MLAVAALAFAATEQTYSQGFVNKSGKATKAKNASAGTKFEVSSIDEDNTAQNQQPKPARQVNVTFPAGSKLDYRAAPVCKTLDESAENPCPRNTIVGKGTADARLPNPGTAPIVSDVTAYNRKNGLFLYVVPRQAGQAPVVLRPTIDGRTLKTKLDPLCVASTNQNGQCVQNDGSPGFEVTLTRFDLTTKPRKRGRRAFVRTPKTCPRAGWKFTGFFRYSDGSTTTLNSIQRCR